MKKVLVTGGAGFLGSHLCERLLDVGDDVLRVDNYFTGTKANIAHLFAHPRFGAMRHDVTFPLYVASQVMLKEGLTRTTGYFRELIRGDN